MIELMFAISIALVACGLAVPSLLAGLNDFRARAAARHLSNRLQQIRMEAIVRRTNTALRLVPAPAAFTYAAFIDGNANGVRSLDIQNGIDRRLSSDEQLTHHFPGVDFGTLPGLPAVDESSTPPGTDPIRLGPSNMVSFTAHGTATPGSLYILGGGRAQLVIRIFGETGKTKILRFDHQAFSWKPL